MLQGYLLILDTARRACLASVYAIRPVAHLEFWTPRLEHYVVTLCHLESVFLGLTGDGPQASAASPPRAGSPACTLATRTPLPCSEWSVYAGREAHCSLDKVGSNAYLSHL
eukprot:6190273-Pleurochrysis_carterae.AAC.1